jgi:hypothetical protein
MKLRGYLLNLFKATFLKESSIMKEQFPANPPSREGTPGKWTTEEPRKGAPKPGQAPGARPEKPRKGM